MAEENVRKAGGTVFFAKDSEEATRYVTELATSKGVKTVVKSKSMVSEEMGLNERLKRQASNPSKQTSANTSYSSPAKRPST